MTKRLLLRMAVITIISTFQVSIPVHAIAPHDQGQRLPNLVPVILDAQEVTDDDPVASHTVVVLRRTNKVANLCSGVIISRRHVIAAEHCLVPATDLAVLFKMVVTAADMAEFKAATAHNVAKVFPTIGAGDIAGADVGILQLSSDIPTTHSPARMVRTDKSEVNAIVAGYGNSSPAEKGAGRLRKTSMKLYQTPIRWRAVTESPTCSGDSGGPAFIEDSTPLQLVGIVSSGDCKEQSSFTNLAVVLDWARQIVDSDQSSD